MDKYETLLSHLNAVRTVFSKGSIASRVEAIFCSTKHASPCITCSGASTHLAFFRKIPCHSEGNAVFLCNDCKEHFSVCGPTIYATHVQKQITICHAMIGTRATPSGSPWCVACNPVHKPDGLCAGCSAAAYFLVSGVTHTLCKSMQHKIALCMSADLLVRDVWLLMYNIWLNDTDFAWETIDSLTVSS